MLIPVSTYTQSELQEIITIALEYKSDDKIKFHSQDLATIATELDIHIDIIKSIEQSWLRDRAQKQKYQAFDRYRNIKVKKSLSRYVAINSFLITLNALTNPLAFLGLSWSVIFLLGAGGFVSLRAWTLTHLQGEEYESYFQKWLQRER
jgi:hypothetical protein